MERKLLLSRFYCYSFCLAAILLPFGQPLVNYSMVFLAFMFLINGKFKSDFKVSERYLIFLPLIFYLIHVLGLLNSHNLKYGMLDIETKFSYFLFPLIFFIKPIDTKTIYGVKLMFVLGCCAVCIYNFIVSYFQYRTSQSIDVFYYIAFSKVMHVQYLTIYLNIAVLVIIDLIFINPGKKAVSIIGTCLIIFFFINISFLSSRLATIVSYMTVPLFVVLKTKSNKAILKHWPFAALILVLVVVTDYFVLSHSNRFEQVEILFNSDNDFRQFDKKEYNSANLRIPLWINAAEVIENNKLLGVGTGDIKEELDLVYKKNKFAYAEASHFSPHNQILHTGIILGFVGIAMLLAMLLIPLYFSIRYKSYLLMCFIIIFFFNMMTESILERQAGIILFSFFYVILIAELYEDIKKAGDLPA